MKKWPYILMLVVLACLLLFASRDDNCSWEDDPDHPDAFYGTAYEIQAIVGSHRQSGCKICLDEIFWFDETNDDPNNLVETSTSVDFYIGDEEDPNDPNTVIFTIAESESVWSICHDAEANTITLDGVSLEQAFKRLWYLYTYPPNDDPNEYLMSAEIVYEGSFCECETQERLVTTCLVYGCDGKDCTICGICGKKVRHE